jgi:hypothetical protein
MERILMLQRKWRGVQPDTAEIRGDLIWEHLKDWDLWDWWMGISQERSERCWLSEFDSDETEDDH